MNDKNTKYKGHAVALFSGGLDSALAILLMRRQNIKVTALTFMTHFGCDISDRSSCGGNPYPVSEKFGFDVKLMHLGEKFVEIVKNPKYGYGKNMNPCVDCRILMLREAKTFMDLIGADFIITGEVLGQRPKSQMRNSMNTVIRDSELKGRLVRPLSAKLFEETIPEKEGMLNRDLLEGISGRSRKRQMKLAEEFGLEDYPSPAAGCLLTDPSYSRRLKDLIENSPSIDFNDLNLLRVGRHFRINENSKVIVGRNEEDNDKIRQYAKNEHYMLEALGTGSPITLLITSNGDNSILDAASLTARYCGKRKEAEVEVTCINDGDGRKFKVSPADEKLIDKYILR